MHRVVKIVAPLRIETEAACLARCNEFRIVEVALRNESKIAAQMCGKPVYLRGKLFEKMHRRPIVKGMYRIQAKAVEMVLPKPHQSVLEQKATCLLTAFLIQIHSRAPRCLISLSEVRPETAQIVSRRPKMVINHIEQHGQPTRMARIVVFFLFFWSFVFV